MSIPHLIPVVTSTVPLWFAFDQHYFLGNFLHKDVEPGAKHVLAPYWNTVFCSGACYVIAALVGTMVSIAAILNNTSGELLQSKGSYSWYVARAFLAAGHLTFVPAILPKISSLSYGGLTPPPSDSGCVCTSPELSPWIFPVGSLVFLPVPRSCRFEYEIEVENERKTLRRGFQGWREEFVSVPLIAVEKDSTTVDAAR